MRPPRTPVIAACEVRYGVVSWSCVRRLIPVRVHSRGEQDKEVDAAIPCECFERSETQIFKSERVGEAECERPRRDQRYDIRNVLIRVTGDDVNVPRPYVRGRAFT